VLEFWLGHPYQRPDLIAGLIHVRLSRWALPVASSTYEFVFEMTSRVTRLVPGNLSPTLEFRPRYNPLVGGDRSVNNWSVSCRPGLQGRLGIG